MNVLIVLFFLSLALGQLEAISLGSGVRIYVHELILGLIALVWLLRRPKLKKASAFLSPILGFAAVGLVSLLWQLPRFGWAKVGISSLYLVRWLFYSVAFFVAATTNLAFLVGLYCLGTVLALLGFLQLWVYPNLRNLYYLGWDPHYQRLFSTLLDPNFSGLVLVLTLLLGIYFWQSVPRLRKLIVVGEAANLIALMFTNSRSSYLALLIGVGTYLVLARKVKILVLALATLVVLILVWPRQTSDTLNLFRQDTALARVSNWETGWNWFTKSPILGYGFDSLRNLPLTKPPLDPSIPSNAAAGVDNSFLFLGLTTGIVGLAVYLWLLTRIWLIKTKNIALSLLLRSSLLAILGHSFFVNSLFYPWILLWLWILAGRAAREKSLPGPKPAD